MVGGGIRAHVELSQKVREKAEVAWLVSGGDALRENGEETNEYQMHHGIFVLKFVEEELHVAYGRNQVGHCFAERATIAVKAVDGNDTHLGHHGAALAISTRLHNSEVYKHASDEILHTEARLVSERSLPGRPRRNIIDMHGIVVEDGLSWNLPSTSGCSWKVPSTVGGKVASNESAPPLLKRRITNGFCDSHTCRELCGYAIHAMHGVHATCGQTAVPAGPPLGANSETLINDIVGRCRAHITSEFGLVSAPFFAGAVLTRIVPDSAATTADKGYPYLAHVDRARVASDDYAAVLHLTTQGTDFTGGDFVFVDDLEDIMVAPCRGRLVSFTCGPENLHRVIEVTQGARFTLAMWFTLSESHAARTHLPNDAHIVFRKEATYRDDQLVLRNVAPTVSSDRSSRTYERVDDDGQYESVD